MALGGRPKIQGGHKRIDITLDKNTIKKIEKLRKAGGNVSCFIESQIKPELEKLDPAELSIHIYAIEAYLSNEIIEAHNKGDFESLRVLGSIAKQIDDYRKLAHIPPLTLQIPAKVSSEQCQTEKVEILDVRPSFGGVKLSIETCQQMGEPIFKVKISNKEKLIFSLEELRLLQSEE